MNYQEYIKSDLWKKRRYAALERANFKCQLCGEIDSLEVHHKTYERLGNESPDDLIVVCNSHHWEKHTPPPVVIEPKSILCGYSRGLVCKIDTLLGSYDKKGRLTQETREKIKKTKGEFNRHIRKCKKCDVLDSDMSDYILHDYKHI